MKGAWVAIAALAAAGCGGERLRGQIGSVHLSVQAARASGAQYCAPAELARAVAHIEFAALEFQEGDYYRARSELAVAEKSAAEALRRSPRGRCAAAGVPDSDGDGVADDRDECTTTPEDRDGAQDDDGCPDKDNDSDGLADAVDKCPDDAEDQDAFDDDDGCPDKDNDRDQLVDRIDQCPDKPEDVDGIDDDDGCPDCDDDGDRVPECPRAADRCPGRPGRPPDGCPVKGVVVTDRRIQIGEPVRFDRGKATIRPGSHELLAEVARVLADNPRLRVRVDVHTDSRGGAGLLKRLSRARALAIKRFLVARGIDPNRVSSEGYGGDRPIAENRTPAGRAQNRRVEFVITGR